MPERLLTCLSVRRTCSRLRDRGRHRPVGDCREDAEPDRRRGARWRRGDLCRARPRGRPVRPRPAGAGPAPAGLGRDGAAKAFVAQQGFAAVAAEAAGVAGVTPRFAAGAVPGFEPLAALGDDGSTRRPSPGTHGAPMLYTSGTSGRPKGVRRPLTGMDPDDAAAMATWFFGLFAIAPFDGHVHLCGSPLYHTAVLNFATISIQLGHPVVLMDRFEPEEALALIERHRVTPRHLGPTQFRRLLALPAPVRAKYAVSPLRSAIHPPAPRPQESTLQLLDWWGPGIVEYYAATEGGGTL